MTLDVDNGPTSKEVPMARRDRVKQAAHEFRGTRDLLVVVVLSTIHVILAVGHARDSGRVDPAC